MSTWVLSSRIKRPQLDDGQSTQSSVKAKNESSYTSTLAVCLHGVNIDKFTLTFTVRDYISGQLLYARGYVTLLIDPTVKTKLPYADAVHCDRPSTQEQFFTDLTQQQIPCGLIQPSVCQVVRNALNVKYFTTFTVASSHQESSERWLGSFVCT
jgi:hypothetical protein